MLCLLSAEFEGSRPRGAIHHLLLLLVLEHCLQLLVGEWKRVVTAWLLKHHIGRTCSVLNLRCFNLRSWTRIDLFSAKWIKFFGDGNALTIEIHSWLRIFRWQIVRRNWKVRCLLTSVGLADGLLHVSLLLLRESWHLISCLVFVHTLIYRLILKGCLIWLSGINQGGSVCSIWRSVWNFHVATFNSLETILVAICIEDYAVHRLLVPFVRLVRQHCLQSVLWHLFLLMITMVWHYKCHAGNDMLLHFG